MKILNTAQTRLADAATIATEPIASIDLMERAATACYDWLHNKYPSNSSFSILCGIGNNGGDGLVIARLLQHRGYQVKVYVIEFSEQYSADFTANLKRLKEDKVSVEFIREAKAIELAENDIVIDAIFGSGITRPVEGFTKSIISDLNDSAQEVVAIDLPSGLFSESNIENDRSAIIKATYTLTFQQPKLAMMLPQNYDFVGEFFVLDIGLDEAFIRDVDTPWYYTDEDVIKPMLQERRKFEHKGNFGHALLVAGSTGKIGAAVLSGNACLRTGVGLLTIHTPKIGCDIIQTAVPEAMCIIDKEQDHISEYVQLDNYSALGCGPGIGLGEPTQSALKILIQNTKVPMVIDADAINIIAQNKTWLSFLPPHSILTPHPKEFERLVGKWSNEEERLNKQLELSVKNNLVVVLKGANSSISLPNGEVHFNSTGNPGMATAGSGDVLTGIITSLLAQSYSPSEAAIIGVYLHGFAGDKAGLKLGQSAMIASDIIAHIPAFFKAFEIS